MNSFITSEPDLISDYFVLLVSIHSNLKQSYIPLCLTMP